MRTSLHLRLPASLAEAVRERADQEQCSVNTLLIAIVAGAIGYPVEDGDK
jgi:hypothetical protein